MLTRWFLVRLVLAAIAGSGIVYVAGWAFAPATRICTSILVIASLLLMWINDVRISMTKLAVDHRSSDILNGLFVGPWVLFLDSLLIIAFWGFALTTLSILDVDANVSKHLVGMCVFLVLSIVVGFVVGVSVGIGLQTGKLKPGIQRVRTLVEPKK